MQTRRHLLAGIAAAAFGPSLTWASVGNPVAVSAATKSDGSHILVGLRAKGDISFSTPLAARGHAAAVHPQFAEVVAIARRPGTFALVIDCATGHVRETLAAPKGRHFYGHGTFSQDGKLLFTTENDIETGEGRIGVWDRALSYSRVGEFASGGIGPHEIIRRPDGVLAVANGGIRTHPDSGREKLNLETMRPNLSVFTGAGVLLDQAEVPAKTHHNSLRHLAVQADGTIACGFQWQADPYESPPLLALYRGGGALQDVQIDDQLLFGLNGYVGSVAAFGSHGFIASSPRGGRVFSLDPRDGALKAHQALDVCGVARCTTQDNLVTDGNGHVYLFSSSGLHLQTRHMLAFDNHLVAVTL